MAEFKILTAGYRSVTTVSDDFIEHYMPTANGDYVKNISQNIFVDDNIVLKDAYTIPLFNYMIADSYSVGGRISTKIPIIGKRFTSFIGAFAEASTQQYIGNEKMFKSTHFNQFCGGVNYTF